VTIHPAEQGSAAWLEARAGIVTASELDNLVTPLFEPRTGEMVNTYLATKLAERWLQGPLPGFSSFATEQGTLLEDEARPWYELEHNTTVQRVGLCIADNGRVGCSPDGLIGEDEGLEIKCPQPTAHVKYLLAGTLPKQYAAQVHGSMLVTGRPWWVFLSYRRGFPAFVLRVRRNDVFCAKLQTAIDAFLATYDEAWEKLCDRNGGPPPKREPATQPKSPYIDVYDRSVPLHDIIP